MRSYWLKIALGALGIFAVGMLGITGFRSVKGKVRQAINSSDPIPIPLVGLVPFRLDQDRLGSLSGVEIQRSDPQHVSGLRVLVKLADSVTVDRLASCQMSLDDLDNLGDHTTFRCQAAGDSAPGMERFGVVVIKGGSDSFPLLLPAKAVADLRQTTFELRKGGFHVQHADDAVREAISARTEAMRDELSERIDARSDSADALQEQSEALEASAADSPLKDRRRLQRSADSVRALMRAMVDRMKVDEQRMRALDDVGGLTPAERDSLARMGTQIADSVQRMVIKELQRVQQDLEKKNLQARGSNTAVEAPAVPPVPKVQPVAPARPR